MALVKVAETAEIPAGKCKRVLVKRRPITVFNCGGEYFAIDDTCTHDEASLAGGEVDGCVVTCPLHGAQFDIKTGAALSLPAATPVETYQVTLDGTAIMVEV
jgi:3-phenylpropionate/trans-cinnamate dioxygenase ferredoxin subunit